MVCDMWDILINFIWYFNKPPFEAIGCIMWFTIMTQTYLILYSEKTCEDLRDRFFDCNH